MFGRSRACQRPARVQWAQHPPELSLGKSPREDRPSRGVRGRQVGPSCSQSGSGTVHLALVGQDSPASPLALVQEALPTGPHPQCSPPALLPCRSFTAARGQPGGPTPPLLRAAAHGWCLGAGVEAAQIARRRRRTRRRTRTTRMTTRRWPRVEPGPPLTPALAPSLPVSEWAGWRVGGRVQLSVCPAHRCPALPQAPAGQPPLTQCLQTP